MKLFATLLLLCLIDAFLVEATYYGQGVTYRVRRSGVKSPAGQYVQQVQESSYDSGALLGGSVQRSNVRAVPSRPAPAGAYRVSQYQEGQQYGGNQVAGQADAEPTSYGGVQGVPNKDFPAYSQVPQTSFSCSKVPNYEFGMYADEETQCQAYHVCYQGRKDSFLCGVGTVFNQAILACDYWYSVDCSRSREFYSANADLGKAGAEPSSGGGSTQVSNQWSQQQRQQQQPRPQAPARQQYQQRQQQQQQQQYSSSSSSQYEQSAVTGQRAQQQPQQPQYGRSKSTVQQYSPARQTLAYSGQYGSQQVSTGVQSVSQYTDQAAVRAQQVQAPVVASPQQQTTQRYGKSKYRAGAAGNQLSPSYRSKALSQVQQQSYQNDGQYVQQQQQQQPQQQRPYKPQPNQLQVDTFRDTQQKLVY